MNRQHCVWPAVAGVLTAAAAAWAQEGPVGQPSAPEPGAAEAPTPPTPSRASFSVSVRSDLGFSADLDDDAGDVQVLRFGGEVGAAFMVDERSRLTLGFDYERSQYEWGGTGFLAGVREPFEDVNRYGVSASFFRQETATLAWFVGGGVTLSAEEGADLGKSVHGVVFGGLRFQVAQGVWIGGGTVVSTRLEDNALVVPLLSVDWQINEQWRLSNEGRLGLTLSYAPDERWAVYLAGEYDYRDIRLDDDGPVPDGVARVQRVPIALGVRLTPNPRVAVDAGIGASFFQNFQIDDSDGNELADSDADPAPFVTFRATFRF